MDIQLVLWITLSNTASFLWSPEAQLMSFKNILAAKTTLGIRYSDYNPVACFLSEFGLADPYSLFLPLKCLNEDFFKTLFYFFFFVCFY